MTYNAENTNPDYNRNIQLIEAQKAVHRSSLDQQKQLEQGLRKAIPEPFDGQTNWLHRHAGALIQKPDNTLMKYDTNSNGEHKLVPLFSNCGRD